MMTNYLSTLFLKNRSYIHPLKPNETNALEGISNLTLHFSYCDKVRSEWRLYHAEIIPEDAYLNEKEASPIKTRRKVSHWEKAFVIDWYN